MKCIKKMKVALSNIKYNVEMLFNSVFHKKDIRYLCYCCGDYMVLEDKKDIVGFYHLMYKTTIKKLASSFKKADVSWMNWENHLHFSNENDGKLFWSLV